MNRKTTKLLSTLLLAVAVAVTQIPVSDVEAQTATSDFEMDGTTLLRYSGTAEAVSVPDEVKAIASEAFAGNDNLVKITIGGNTEKIGSRAFADCPELRTVKVEDSVTEIAAAAFVNNKELVNVSLGSGVRKLDGGIFAGCSKLEELVLSEDNPYLAYMDGILYDDELKTVYELMPACEKGAYTLPGTVSEIKAYAFWGNPYLERVTLGSGIREIPAYAFSNCINLKNVSIPLPVRNIEAKAFEDCVNLETVKVPESVTSIHATAFDGCPGVDLIAPEGSYGAEYAADMKKDDVTQAEYQDVENSQVIMPDGAADSQQPAEGTQSVPGESTPVPKQPDTLETEVYKNGILMGESNIVAGKAMIFIDNRLSQVYSGITGTGKLDLERANETGQNGQAGTENSVNLESFITQNAQKGSDFPKFTVVGDSKVASQAYYQDKELTEYTVKEGIKEIGEFAFARTGLIKIEIPEGIEKIGYGAFYHCDVLSEVTIPVTVTEIEPYAFDKTPWITNTRTATYPFLIVGDGILIDYAGGDSVVNIPGGVKQIGPGVFKDHMGVTAVNIPDSVEVIGEEAFSGCKNLKTVNGGSQLIKIKDRAFMDCPLSSVVISDTVNEIGLRAYDLLNGTDTAVFMGAELPVLTYGQTSERLSNKEYRSYALGTIQTAIVPNQVKELKGTILEEGTYGFQGSVLSEAGSKLQDNSSGIKNRSEAGVRIEINSKALSDRKENITAEIPGNTDAYVLKIEDSDLAVQAITAAYGELYGGREPSGLTAYDISLYEASGSIPISRLGKQYITLKLPVPSSMKPDYLHVVTLDSDGQLEAVKYQTLTLEDGDYIQFAASHFSSFGIYEYSSLNGQAQVKDGQAVIKSLSGTKDASPDTGDYGIHPKWFLALGILASSIALFFYKGKKVPVRKER